MPPLGRKRAASEAARDAQRLRGEDVRLSVVLEYHRNIARATAVVRDAAAPVVCRVSAGTIVLEAGEKRTEVQLDWPLHPGTFTAHVQDGVQVVTLGAQSARLADVVPRTPWSVLATEQRPVLALACATCGATLSRFQGAARLRALPSENWEELVDAWMCHGDQRLNASVVQGRADVEHTRTPQPNDVWVGALLVRIASTQLIHAQAADAAIPGPWEVRC